MILAERDRRHESERSVMSDSEQRQLHVPYREYHSQNNTSPATTAAAAAAAAALVETDALVDLSVAPVTSSHHQRLSLQNDQLPSPTDLLPDVEFIPGLSNDQTLAIDSSGIDRESQPLLGRMELDVTFNRFPGLFQAIPGGVPLSLCAHLLVIDDTSDLLRIIIFHICCHTLHYI